MTLVSIIIPCYNEGSTIQLLLSALDRQTFPKDQMEVILADGMSSDNTREEIASFQRKHPQLTLRVVDNPKRIIPAGLNRAIQAANGEFIVRLDGHSIPTENYVECCLEALRSGKGDNVGGIWEIRSSGKGWIARSIAAAAAHPFGVGDALYRYATQPAAVDTVPFGSFRRETLDRIGYFDETLLTNEDYELNARIRQQGGTIWMDPKIRSGYFARSSLGALAKQYYRYGFWKWRMLKRYPKTLRWRQALPPLFVISIAGLLLLSPWLNLARILLLVEVCLYLLLLVVGSIAAARKQKDASLLVGMPLAMATMHTCWGTGLIISALRK
jgi:glycosyltransferase involved in cell wall biosynthesis